MWTLQNCLLRTESLVDMLVFIPVKFPLAAVRVMPSKTQTLWNYTRGIRPCLWKLVLKSSWHYGRRAEVGDEFKEQLGKEFTCRAILSFALWFWNYFNYLSFKKVELLMETKKLGAAIRVKSHSWQRADLDAGAGAQCWSHFCLSRS